MGHLVIPLGEGSDLRVAAPLRSRLVSSRAFALHNHATSDVGGR